MNLEGMMIRAYGEYFIVAHDEGETLVVSKPWEAWQKRIPVTDVTHVEDKAVR